MTLEEINELNDPGLYDLFLECCGSKAWANCMVAGRPFRNTEQMRQYADDKWWELTDHDWLEAFSKHPRIGETRELTNWSTQEQMGMSGSADSTTNELASLNDLYSEKFGWIYIVCATGKTGAEMLALLKQRMRNESQEELRIAAQEQAKITDIRIGKLLAR